MLPFKSSKIHTSSPQNIHMRKFYIFFANMLFVFHYFLGIFILVGWLFPEIKLLYLAVLFCWLFSWVLLGYCPPTRWEFLLRRKYDKSIDPNAEAVKYYLYKFFKINIPSKSIFTGGLIVFIILTILSFLN